MTEALIKNSRHEVDILALAPDGQGLGELDDRQILVDGALPGERVVIKLIKVAEHYAVGRLNAVLIPSEDRVPPFCAAFRRCGGCTLQHLEYAAQCQLKTEMLRESLAQAGLTIAHPVRDMLGMAHPRHYRQKAQYPVVHTPDGVRLGFYARHSHDIVDHTECDAQPAVMTRIRNTVREFLEERQVSIYDEGAHQGLVRHLVIRRASATGDCLVVLVLNGAALPHQRALITTLTQRFPEITGILINHNTPRTNSILGPVTEVIWGAATIADRLGDQWFEMSPQSFYQVNPEQTEVLYRQVRRYADLQGTETVFDLYCGIGTIALSLARSACQVYGIDSVPQAIRNAAHNAVRNAVTNAEFVTGAAEQVFPDMLRQGLRADVVILDPPRKGCDPALLEALAACRPKRVIYVSCHPKTLIRDIGILEHAGFRGIEIQPVDLFPHTMHVECVAKIELAGF